MQNKHPTIAAKTNHKAGRYMCNICDKRFRKPSLLLRHEAVHLSEKAFKCSECAKQFTQKASLQRHYDAQHGMDKKLHQCAKCGQGFSQKSNLQLHDKNVHLAIAKGATTANAKGFACAQCPSMYASKQALGKHIKAAHSNRNKLAVSEVEDDLILTQNVLEQLKIFQTEMEAYEVPSVSSTKLIADVALEVPQQQPLTSESLVDELNLEGHVKAQSSSSLARYACDCCGKQFRKSYNFLRHHRMHTQERPYKCTFCVGAFRTKTKLNEHMKVHRLDERSGILAKVYRCAVCCQAFSSLRQLDKHTSIHAITFTLAYKCKICAGTFKTSTALSTHKHDEADEDLNYLKQLLPKPIEVYTANTNETVSTEASDSYEVTAVSPNIIKKSFKAKSKCKCPTCGRIFSNTTLLSKHQRIYHGAYSRINDMSSPSLAARCYKCAYCVRFFKSQTLCHSHMLRHLKRLLNTTDHKSNIINGSVIVTEQATNVIAIVKAFNALHTYQKRVSLESSQGVRSKSTEHLQHKCIYCSKQFKKSYELKRHSLAHSGERLHGCAVCDKSFTLKSTLKEHERTHASERAKCLCIVCGKTYASKKALNIHLRLHTNKQPFSCEQCERKFRTSGQKISHMRVVHDLGRNTDNKE